MAVLPSRACSCCGRGEGFGGDLLLGHKGEIPQQHFLARHPGLHPQPRQGLEFLHLGQNQVFHRGGVGHGFGQGVLRFGLQGRGQGQNLVGAPTLPGMEVGDLGRAPGEGAGLVEDHGGEAIGPLQGFAAPHQDAQFRAPAGAHHDRGGGGQPHGAGAGDDEHRHHADQGPGDGRGRAPEEPGQEGEGRQAHDHRHEDARHLVHQALDGGLAGLGLFHQADDLGQHHVLAHPGGLKDQEAPLVQGGAPDLGSPAPWPPAGSRR